jgi:hypothetical protein
MAVTENRYTEVFEQAGESRVGYSAMTSALRGPASEPQPFSHPPQSNRPSWAMAP